MAQRDFDLDVLIVLEQHVETCALPFGEQVAARAGPCRAP